MLGEVVKLEADKDTEFYYPKRNFAIVSIAEYGITFSRGCREFMSDFAAMGYNKKDNRIVFIFQKDRGSSGMKISKSGTNWRLACRGFLVFLKERGVAVSESSKRYPLFKDSNGTFYIKLTV